MSIPFSKKFPRTGKKEEISSPEPPSPGGIHLVKTKFFPFLYNAVDFFLCRKRGKKSKPGKNSYVNRFAYGLWISLVDNSCGKLCGECGKLPVINRYFSPLLFWPLWKGCIRKMHNLWNTPGFFVLCFQDSPGRYGGSPSKKLGIFPALPIYGGTRRKRL